MKENGNSPKELGTRIRYARKKNGLNQEKLAELVGMTTSAIGSYEIGKSYPSVEVLTRIGSTLNVSFDWLIRGKSESDYQLESVSETPLQQKLQQMEETFRQKEQQYLEIIRNLSLGKDEVIGYIAAVILLVTDSVTYQRVVSKTWSLR